MVESDPPLVSVLMPAFNDEAYVGDAIRSVLAQTWTNWELLVVNDGSTDGTAEIISGFEDPRIRAFHKPNGGIGSARNMALDHARGKFICGLDSDDVFPERSLASRLEVFDRHPDADIVDGRVQFMDALLNDTIRVFEPSFQGDLFPELVSLSGKCFMGFSWMFRWSAPDQGIRFKEDVSHAEDLMFALEYARGKRYYFTHDTVLLYRRTGRTTMSDLAGLERSYRAAEQWLRETRIANVTELAHFRRRRQRIMAGSYWHAGLPLKALRAWLR